MACLNPVVIINPEYKKHTKDYPLVCFNGRPWHCTANYADFPDWYFSPKRNGATPENYEKYYAYNMLGEVINIYILVPCGKCPNCCMQKRTDWTARLSLEQHGRNYLPIFITLTYDDKHLPDDGVNVVDVQKFIKRLRSNLKYRFPDMDVHNIRYAIFSEYGKTTHRPHYHGILYGLNVPASVVWHKIQPILHSSWRNGFIHMKFCHKRSFNYISKYILKGSNVPDGMNPNFHTFSRRGGSIGCYCLSDNELVSHVLKTDDLRVKIQLFGQVKEYLLPKVVANKIYRDPHTFYDKTSIQVFKMFANLLGRVHSQICTYNIELDHYENLFSKNLYQHIVRNGCSIPRNFIDNFFVFSDFVTVSTIKTTLEPLSSFDVNLRLLNWCYEYLNNFYIDLDKVNFASELWQKYKSILKKHAISAQLDAKPLINHNRDYRTNTTIFPVANLSMFCVPIPDTNFFTSNHGP